MLVYTVDRTECNINLTCFLLSSRKNVCNVSVYKVGNYIYPESSENNAARDEIIKMLWEYCHFEVLQFTYVMLISFLLL